MTFGTTLVALRKLAVSGKWLRAVVSSCKRKTVCLGKVAMYGPEFIYLFIYFCLRNSGKIRPKSCLSCRLARPSFDGCCKCRHPVWRSLHRFPGVQPRVCRQCGPFKRILGVYVYSPPPRFQPLASATTMSLETCFDSRTLFWKLIRPLSFAGN